MSKVEEKREGEKERWDWRRNTRVLGCAKVKLVWPTSIQKPGAWFRGSLSNK